MADTVEIVHEFEPPLDAEDIYERHKTVVEAFAPLVEEDA